MFYSVFIFINSQNVIGPQSLFMDEKLIYDGINSILNPESLSTLSYAVLDGGDQRYGRLLWNTIAIFSFIPNLIWGASAIIFVERMVGVTAILVAYLILTRLFVRNFFAQTILLLILFILPFTVYFATTPKPEPLMVLFLSLYLHFSFKKKRFFGPHWIYLGFVLGLKVSGIFIVAAVCAYISLDILRSRIMPKMTEMIKSLAIFLSGIAFTIPTLFSLGLLGLLFYTFSDLRVAKAYLLTMRFTLLGGLGLSFEPSIDYFRNYYAWTFNSANHPSDSDAVTPASWVNFIFERYLNSSVTSLVFLVVLLVLTNLGYRVRRDPESAGRIRLAILLFFFTTTPIVLLVERLWGLYLWVGFIFLACAFVKNTEKAMSQTSKAGKMTLISVVILVTSSLNLHTSFASEVRTLSAIEASEGFLLQQKRFKEITGILNQLSSKNEPRLRVAYDPILWVPNPTNRYEINVFWGPFTDWKSGFDLLIMTSSHLQKEIDLSRSDSSLRTLEVEGFKNHVIAAEEECRVEKC